MRILIADDHDAIRSSVIRLLQSRADVEECAQAANGKEAVEKALEWKPDLVLLDARLPMLSGFDAAFRQPAVRHQCNRSAYLPRSDCGIRLRCTSGLLCSGAPGDSCVNFVTHLEPATFPHYPRNKISRKHQSQLLLPPVPFPFGGKEGSDWPEPRDEIGS